jgi:hypothetical protein
MEKQLKPTVEKEIKQGFFEIRKKFGETDDKEARTMRGGKHIKNNDDELAGEEEVQVYISHLCLHNYHPIFSKFEVNTVKIILHYSSIVYLKKG